MEAEHTGWACKALNNLLSRSSHVLLFIFKFLCASNPFLLPLFLSTHNHKRRRRVHLLPVDLPARAQDRVGSPTRSPLTIFVRHRGSRHSPLANVALPTLTCCRPPLVSSPSGSPLLVSYFSACPSLRLYHFVLIFLSFTPVVLLWYDTIQTLHPSLVSRLSHTSLFSSFPLFTECVLSPVCHVLLIYYTPGFSRIVDSGVHLYTRVRGFLVCQGTQTWASFLISCDLPGDDPLLST